MSCQQIRRRDSTLRRDFRCIMSDGAAFSLMVGIGETYVPAFALALGLGEVAAGLIGTVPLLTGAALQLASPWAVQVLKSHRQWVVLCAVTQAVSLLLMLVLAVASQASPWLVFLPATVYWAAGLATGPTWNAWVDKLVPIPIRATFFARRTRLSHLCVLIGLVSGGLILRRGDSLEEPLLMFAVLFSVAATSRLISAIMLSRQSEPKQAVPLAASDSSYLQTLADLRRLPGTKIVLYLLSVHVAVNIAAPFFTPFMLVHLKLTYTQFMLLLSCGFTGKILALPWAGRFAKRFGAMRLLWIGGVCIVPLSGLWLVSNTMPFLIGLQIAGGMAWAAYELATLLLFFESIPHRQRLTILSLYNVGHALAVTFGALLGATVMQFVADGRTAYLAAFGLSSVGRLLALLLLARAPTQPRPLIQTLPGLRTIAVRPSSGGIERPILSTNPAR